MAGSLNKVQLIGNLGADPEIRRTQDGRPIANMRIATSESWRDKQSGERREKTEWHTVVCFNEGLCGVIEKYVGKGDKVYIEGQLQTRKWQDQDGNDRYSTEIVLQNYNGTLTMLSSQGNGGRDDDRRDDRDGSRSNGSRDDDRGSRSNGGGYGGGGGGGFSRDLDDDIPF